MYCSIPGHHTCDLAKAFILTIPVCPILSSSYTLPCSFLGIMTLISYIKHPDSTANSNLRLRNECSYASKSCGEPSLVYKTLLIITELSMSVVGVFCSGSLDKPSALACCFVEQNLMSYADNVMAHLCNLAAAKAGKLLSFRTENSCERLMVLLIQLFLAVKILMKLLMLNMMC